MNTCNFWVIRIAQQPIPGPEETQGNPGEGLRGRPCPGPSCAFFFFFFLRWVEKDPFSELNELLWPSFLRQSSQSQHFYPQLHPTLCINVAAHYKNTAIKIKYCLQDKDFQAGPQTRTCLLQRLITCRSAVSWCLPWAVRHWPWVGGADSAAVWASFCETLCSVVPKVFPGIRTQHLQWLKPLPNPHRAPLMRLGVQFLLECFNWTMALLNISFFLALFYIHV